MWDLIYVVVLTEGSRAHAYANTYGFINWKFDSVFLVVGEFRMESSRDILANKYFYK